MMIPWGQGRLGCVVRKHGEAVLFAGLLGTLTACAATGQQAQRDRERATYRAQAQQLVQQAESHVRARDVIAALQLAQQARQIPLDLNDVALVRQIDAVASRAMHDGKVLAQRLVEEGQLWPAAQLSDRIATVVPTDKAQRAWADKLRSTIIARYLAEGEARARAGLNAGAAVQFALASALGATDLHGEDIARLWAQSRSEEGMCLPPVNVRVVRADRANCVTCAELTQALQSHVAFQGVGCASSASGNILPMDVVLTLREEKITDTTHIAQYGKALPGVTLATEETYVVDVPRVEQQQITEYETRTEQKTYRDCAPRPGQPRGCHTYTEDVVTQVPVTRIKDVVVVDRIEKVRPLPGPFPADKVVTYPVTTTYREAVIRGNITIQGSITASAPLDVWIVSTDDSHPDVVQSGTSHLLLAADPMTARAMDDITRDAFARARTAVDDAMQPGILTLVATRREQAQAIRQQGQTANAEEIYFGLLQEGAVTTGDDVDSYYQHAYGMPSADLMRTVNTVLQGDHAVAANAAPGQTGPSTSVSTASTTPPSPTSPSANAPVANAAVTTVKEPAVKGPVAPPVAQAPGSLDGFSANELKKLEEESLNAVSHSEATEQGSEGEVPEASDSGTDQPAKIAEEQK